MLGDKEIYSPTVREAVAPLALHAGGAVTLVTDVVAILVSPSNLVRVDDDAVGIEIRKFSITADKGVLIGFDVEPTVAAFDLEIAAGETYYDENIRLVQGIYALNAVSGETPKVRFTAWGV